MGIFINVEDQKMHDISSIEELVSGSQNFVRFTFNLGKEWDNLLTFAQFRQNDKAYNQYLDEDGSVYLPAEIKAGIFTLMLYGSNDKTIATTNYLTFRVNENNLISDAQSTEISESLYNQLVTKINAIIHGEYITSSGGEIFNDYDNNKALSQYSHAEGASTTAGTYAFNIVSWDDSNKTYTLDSVEGLEVKDVFSIKWNTSHINYGEITAIDAENNTITVDNLIINSEDFETKKLFVIDKPNVGTSPFDEAAHAEGSHTQAVLYASHAEGGETQALDRYAHAEGRDTQAGYSAHSEGRGTKALGQMSHAEGGYTEALGHYSHAEGYKTKALSIGSERGASHAEGGETIADGQRSHAEGSKTHTLGYAAHAEGVQTIAGTYAFNILAWDKSNKTYTLDSVEGLAVGDIFSVKWNTSHINYGKIIAINDNTITVDNIIINAKNFETKKLFVIAKPTIGTEPFDEGAHAEGGYTTANVNFSHAEGYKTKAIGDFAHSEGNTTTSSGQATHAEGVQTQATAYGAHSEGNITKARNTAAHAEGSSTIADGVGSHSEGIRTRAVGGGSHAEGFVDDGRQDDYGATEKCAHAEGYNTIASGLASHAEGYSTVASGMYSHAGGLGTKSTQTAQTSIGKYNAEDKDALLIVGNGTSYTKRKNAFVVKNDENGNGYAEVQTVGDSDNSITNKKYIKENTQSKILSGEGIPSPDIGVDGDIYIQIIE